MNKKHLVVLIVIFVLLFVFGIAKQTHKSAQFEKQSESASLEIRFDKNQVEKIQLKKSDASSYDLVRQNGEWQVPSLWNSKADAAKIGNLLEKLSSVSAELRANSADVLGDFEIADADCFRLILFGTGDKELAQLLISYKVPQNGGSFIRLKDSNAVYLANENLFGILGIFGDAKTQELKATYWLSLKYFSIDPTKAEFVTLKKVDDGKESIALDLIKESSQIIDGKAEDRWSIKDVALPFPIASEKVYRFLGQISQGQAREAVDPKGTYGLEKPDWILTTKETDKELKTIKIKAPSDKSADYVYLSSSDTTSIFKVSNSVPQSINVEPSYFEPSTPFFNAMKSWVAIRIKAPEKSFALKKETADGKSTWKLEGQENQPDQQKLTDFVTALQNFSVTEYLKKDKELPKDLGAVSLELENDAKEVVKLDLSPTPDAGTSYTAAKSGVLPAFLIAKSTYDKITQIPQ